MGGDMGDNCSFERAGKLTAWRKAAMEEGVD